MTISVGAASAGRNRTGAIRWAHRDPRETRHDKRAGLIRTTANAEPTLGSGQYARGAIPRSHARLARGPLPRHQPFMHDHAGAGPPHNRGGHKGPGSLPRPGSLLRRAIVKPRIVRENRDCGMTVSAHGDGPAYLALPWPKDCPFTPERFLEEWPEACGVPVRTPASGAWLVPLRDHPCASGPHWKRYWPEFIAAGEPKECEHKPFHCVSSGRYIECPQCGTVISDRRYYTQRKGERRKVGPRYEGGRRRQSGQRERRFFTDRRAKR